MRLRSALAGALLSALGLAMMPEQEARAADSVAPARPVFATVELAKTEATDPAWVNVARDVDAALGDAIRDLGLAPEAGRGGSAKLEAALTPGDGKAAILRLKLGAASTSGRVIAENASVEAVVMLRKLVRGELREAAPRVDDGGPPPRERLAGRVTLMGSAAVFGGFAGASLQAASGSYDARLLVPLTVVGAGVGLGAAYLASGEWDVSAADAWFFTSGAVWGSAAGHLIFQGRFAEERASRDRWTFGLVGGGAGATLAISALALHPMTNGGALLANAGGAAGLGLGAVVQLAATKSAATAPYTGMGYGAALGWLASATLAVNVRPRWIDAVVASIPGIPSAGVIGESQAGRRTAPILGLSLAGSLARLPGAFHF